MENKQPPKPKLESLSATFSQSGDAYQDSHVVQTLNIEAIDAGSGFFLRLKTDEHGWSIDSKEEILEIIERFNNALSNLK